MELAFYGSSVVAILATIGVISGTNPMHALLNLIISLIAVGMIFFSLGAYFVGAMQIIVYAGAIMVLFVFVVMMLNLGTAQDQERQWLKFSTWIGPLILTIAQLAVFYAVLHGIPGVIDGTPMTAKQVGISLYGPYVLAVELASLLLLAGLVAAYHLGRENGRTSGRGDFVSSRNQEEDE